MHKLSIIALIAASLAFSSVAFGAGVTVNAGAATSTSVAADAAGVSVNADATTSASASANTQADTGTSSSAAAANGSSSAAAASSAPNQNGACGTAGASGLVTSPIDATALAGITAVTVFSTTECAGLGDLNAANAGTGASLSGNAMVAKAITDAGYSGQQVVGYMVDGTSLTVYVKK